jgi:hypothetical protein
MRSASRRADRYLHAGVIVLSVSGAAALYLNFQGVSCLAAIAKTGDQVRSQEDFEELRRSCFIITNSYVYSLFGVVAGVILVVVWLARKRKKSYDSS